MNRIQITVLLALAALIWGIWLLVAGVPIGMAHLTPFSATVSAIVLILAGLNQWFWKWSIFRGWLVARPVFIGTWKAELVSSYENPETGVRISPITAYLVVRQTYLSVSIRLFSAETSSRLLGEKLQQAEDGEWNFFGVYLDTPKVAVRERSQIHHGAVALCLGGNPVNQIAGHYWTDRGTRGDIRAAERIAYQCASFEEAEKMFKAKLVKP